MTMNQTGSDVSDDASEDEDREEPEIREIQLAHFSVQAYLVSGKVEGTFAADLQEPTARAAIAETCLAYILELDDRQVIERLCNLYPLAEYAARYLVGNAVRDSKGLVAVHKLALELFASRPLYRLCCQLHDPDAPWRRHNSHEYSTLYYTSLCGLCSCVQELLKRGADVNAQGGQYGNALQAVSSSGYGAHPEAYSCSVQS